MTGERWVLLGLAPPRAPWFEALARWATSAAIAAEFIKCISAEEVRVRLASGRPHSALLIDASSPAFDRDIVDAARTAFTPVIAVCDDRHPRFSGQEVGVAAELGAGFSAEELLDALSACCQMVGSGSGVPPPLGDSAAPEWLGQLFSVCGPGGTGASTAAIALAQGLAADPRYARRVLLADLALRADQAMLHDAHDLGPGVQEIVDAHRLGRADPDEVWRTTFDVPRRGYRLLLGLRQPHAWSALRPRAIDAAVDSLRRSFQVVVADTTGDVEGEAESGSINVEERNHLARCAVQHSSAVVAVGSPGLKGIHSLAGLIRTLIGAGVSPARLVAVVNRSPRNPRTRAEMARALTSLLDGSSGAAPRGGRGWPDWTTGAATGTSRAAGPSPGIAVARPVYVPERKIEDALRDGAPLPAALVDPLVRAAIAVSERQADEAPARPAPALIEPGTLGAWPETAERQGGGS